jgi:hypothetical protein
MHYIYAYVMNPKEQAFSDCKLNDHHTFILAKKTEIPLFFSGNKQDQDLAYIEPQTSTARKLYIDFPWHAEKSRHKPLCLEE